MPQDGMAGAVPCDAALCVSYLEEIMANIKEIEALTNAFGPSGFEDEVIREVKNWCGGLDVANDAMYNVYATMKKKKAGRPCSCWTPIWTSADSWYSPYWKTDF